mgnify:CR=1 FL=1
MRNDTPATHPQHVKKLRDTVLLVNLGTPEKPTYLSTMRFLREFLSDRRVINIPKWIWYPILYGFILPFRSRSAMLKYRLIAPEGEMPLLKYSTALCEAVRSKLNTTASNIHVELAMRYGSMSIDATLKRLKDIPHRHLIIIPLFPQYSATTSASIFDEVARSLKNVGLRCKVDNRNEKINYKVREHSLSKTPIIAVVGEKEIETRSINLRRLGSKESQTISLDAAIKALSMEATPPDIKTLKTK